MADKQRLLRVVKLGGSLLELNDLNSRIEKWLSRQKPAVTIWIVGGGKLVEAIRRQNTCSPVNAEDIHWSCIGKMDENAALLASWFPAWIRFEGSDDDEVDDPCLNQILSSLNWTQKHASHLPKTWDVTSDSIAATFANWIGASELVLIKSTDPPNEASMEQAILEGFVDRYFLQALNSCDTESRIATRYSVRVVNLRASPINETFWTR